MSLAEAGDYTRVWGANAVGCDSIVTLHLIVDKTIVRAEEFITDTVCPGSDYQGRLSDKIINGVETWTDSLRVLVNGVPTDSIYNYTVMSYVVSNIDQPLNVLAVCGKAINVTEAASTLNAFIESEPLYAPNPIVSWYELNGESWNTVGSMTIDATMETVTVKYTISTDCGVFESEPLVVKVEIPTPENTLEMKDVPAVSKYGERILLINLQRIEEEFGWDVAEEDVIWYQVVGEIDKYADPNAVMDDKLVAVGYYCTSEDGTPLQAGQYYARINHEPVSTDDCGGILQTILLSFIKPNAAPMLAPSVVKPSEVIRLMNLDPTTVSSVNVYSASGELLESFQVAETYDTMFNAAHMAGYYIVEVQTESDKVTLRYIVK